MSFIFRDRYVGFFLQSINLLFQPVFGIRILIRPDPILFGLKDTDPDPSLFHTKLRNFFFKCTKK